MGQDYLDTLYKSLDMNVCNIKYTTAKAAPNYVMLLPYSLIELKYYYICVQIDSQTCSKYVEIKANISSSTILCK